MIFREIGWKLEFSLATENCSNGNGCSLKETVLMVIRGGFEDDSCLISHGEIGSVCCRLHLDNVYSLYFNACHQNTGEQAVWMV